MSDSEPDAVVTLRMHSIGLYVERHDTLLTKAECSCGWKTGWISAEERDRLLNEHSQNLNKAKHDGGCGLFSFKNTCDCPAGE